MPSGSGRPPSFHYEHYDEWATWVLDNGLPALPSVLSEDDEVPISYWAGPRCGSVLFRSWDSPNRPKHPDFVGRRDVNTDHYSYWRTDHGWESTRASGGSGGPRRDPLARAEVPDDFAIISGSFREGRVAGVTGTVGRSAVIIELTDAQGTIRRDIAAPLGDFVVCYEAGETVIVRLLDSNDQPLLAQTRGPLDL